MTLEKAYQVADQMLANDDYLNLQEKQAIQAIYSASKISEKAMDVIEALNRLIQCLGVDNTAGVMGIGAEGEGLEGYCTVIGNVDVKLLRTLGFDIPKASYGVIPEGRI